MDMVGEQGKALLQKQYLVVVSPRMKALVKQLGFIREPVIAQSALDDDVLLAIELAQKQHGKEL